MTYDICNTCFLIPVELTKAECAAWVQALGSVSAIVIGIITVRYQQVKEEKRRKESRRLEARGVLNALKWIFLEIANQSENCLFSINGQHVRWDFKISEFKQLEIRLNGMVLEKLPDPGLMSRLLEIAKAIRLTVQMVGALEQPRNDEIKTKISQIIAKIKEEALLAVTEVTQVLKKISTDKELKEDWHLIDQRKKNRELSIEVLAALEKA